MTKQYKEVPVKDLRPVCDPSVFQFTSTSELPILTDMTGQERAMRATSFGIDIQSPGYHIFALGPAGTGMQGVLIPQSNVKNLMLREDVVETVAAGKFHIYPITTLDEGIELLTGVEAGTGNADGNYPENTVNLAVQKRLSDLAEKVQAFSKDSNQSEPVREKELAYDHNKTA